MWKGNRDYKEDEEKQEEIKTTFLNKNFILSIGGKIQKEKILCHNSNCIS